MGCVLLLTHFGVVMSGKRCVKCRSISKLAEPEPIMIPARSSMTATEVEANCSPAIARDDKCLLMFLSFAIPPR
ncbi:unannotated protein [freshwater metagenome]|uniref:Unannotated protein n=1 Tax=freshwater metagenome TaxID=449393 RepID=A0A6J6EB90_9ZZZZ